jgi:hypothetical protein
VNKTEGGEGGSGSRIIAPAALDANYPGALKEGHGKEKVARCLADVAGGGGCPE